MLLAGGLAIAGSASACQVVTDPSWSTLKFRARKLFVSARMDIQLSLLEGSEAAAKVSQPFEGEGIEPSGDCVALLNIRSRMAGKKSRLELFLDPANSAAIQYFKWELGDKDQFKDYRFTTTGMARRKVEPLAGEAAQPVEAWSHVRTEFRPLPEAAVGRPISEPTALPYLISSANLREPGDTFEFYVFSDYDVYRVTGTASGWVDSRVDFKTAEGRVKGEMSLLEIRFGGEPVGSAGDGEFELFGLSGDIRALVDVTRQIPVEVQGKMKVLGRVKFRLERVTPWVS